ncbi:hypothetical protein SAMN05421755_102716 [Nitrosomonas sp. Nm33]|nr:hypothetical protein SAMN05421755_102716 [Nitrosomonas sp. Nm33]
MNNSELIKELNLAATLYDSDNMEINYSYGGRVIYARVTDGY